MQQRTARLAAIVGAEHVADDGALLDEYASDHSDAPAGRPVAIVRPGTAAEVRRIVAWANETATPLVPVSSGGPHFHGDTVPSVPGAVMLDLRRLDRILRIDRRNRMVVIEPGVTYPQLQAALAEAGHARHAAAAAAGQQVGGRQPARAPADADPPLQLRPARAAARLRCGLGQRRGAVHRRGRHRPHLAGGAVAGRLRAGRPKGAGADRLLPPAHRRAGHDGHRHLGER